MLRSSRYVLGVAFVFSVMLHLIVVPLVQAPPEQQPDEPLPLVLESARPTPTPRPTPHPTPSQRPTPRPTLPPRRAVRTPPHRRRVNVAHEHARQRDAVPAPAAASGPVTRAGSYTGAGAAIAAPSAASRPTALPSPDPAPSATRPPACAQPNVAAATVEPAVPETPPIAAQQGISGDVTVLVSLDEHSRVTGAHVISSPSSLLDDAALRAARDSTFRTEIRDCRPIAADYAFIVEFTNQ